VKDLSSVEAPAVTGQRTHSFERSMLALLALAIFAFLIPASAQDGRKVKYSIQPSYPELAKKNNIQGTARLQIVISADGSVKEVKVLGGSPVLTQAATEAVKKWKYEPASGESTAVLKFDFKPETMPNR
jgi:TonB family protein